MPTDTPLSSLLARSLDGYDLDAETERAARHLAPTTVAGHSLHRATAKVSVAPEPPSHEATREAHRAAVFQSTLDPDSPVIELGWPSAGHYVMDSRGVHFDLYLGVAQRLVDDAHPAITRALSALDRYGLFVRREINTDDFLTVAPHAEGVHTPQALASLLGGALAKSFPGTGSWRSFFTNSGTESVEACLKLACQVRYKRFLEAHGEATLARVMAELGIREFAPLAVDRGRPEPVYEDYPFFLVGCADAFHGRTLGALQITASKKAQKVGYPRARWVKHVPFDRVGALGALIDPRPLAALLATPGELARVVADGRVPRDLLAGMILEPLQGEGGYVPASRAFIADCQAVCRDAGALFMLDEVQTFGRSGTLFFGEQLGAEPDAVALAKGLFVGAMVARAEYDRYLHPGWHSNTWGGGKVFDTQVAYAVLDTLLHERGPVFDGRSLPENLALKAKLVERALDALRERHPEVVTDVMVRGGLARISVRERAAVIHAGYRRGLKLLPCGRASEVSAIRMIFLADVLGREVLDAADLLDLALGDLAGADLARGT